MTQTAIILKMIFDRWEASIKNMNGLLDDLSDETLQKQIAPGKNRGVYLLGHLVAVHDDMLVLLGLGDRLYPELREPFLEKADNEVTPMPTAAVLRSYWANQCQVLKERSDSLQETEWFEKHTAVSAEDFAKEPYRNKLNIILTRTTHLQYHIGQLRLLK